MQMHCLYAISREICNFYIDIEQTAFALCGVYLNSKEGSPSGQSSSLSEIYSKISETFYCCKNLLKSC